MRTTRLVYHLVDYEDPRVVHVYPGHHALGAHLEPATIIDGVRVVQEIDVVDGETKYIVHAARHGQRCILSHKSIQLFRRSSCVSLGQQTSSAQDEWMP